MHTAIQIIGRLGRDAMQRESQVNGAPYTVLSVATRRAWKDSEGNWQSKTDWHRVVCFNRTREAAAELHKGDQVFVSGSLVSSTYERQLGKGKKSETVKLTYWQIHPSVLRKLHRTSQQVEATVSDSESDAAPAPF